MDPLNIKTIVTRPGTSFTASANPLDQDGGVVADGEITWKTSNPDVAAPEKGSGKAAKIWSKKPGQATITAYCGTAFQSFIVKVETLKATKMEITFSEPKY